MTKNEFMEKLAKELKARGVADAADIEEEYEQHFAFKLADGYSEEEIAAKLGDPAKLAAQITAESAPAGRSGKKAAVVTGFVFLDIVTVLGFIALAAFALVLAAAAIGFAAVGVGLITKTSLYGVIPAMPYGSALILGVASLFPMPLKATYAASKRFLLDFATALRQELRGEGVNVLALCPAGMVTTEKTAAGHPRAGVLGRGVDEPAGSRCAQNA